VLREAFVVAGAAAAADPGVGALDDPAAGQYLEPVAPAEGGPVDGADLDSEFASCPVLVGAVVAVVGPGQGEAAAAAAAGPGQDGRGGVAVGGVGSGDDDRHEQAEGTGQEVAFAAVDFFVVIEPAVAAGTTPSADSCTDCESMTAADGSGWRPPALRTAARSSR
jgi:hypothetical protein